MKKILTLLPGLLILFSISVNAQTIDTLQWLKNNIEQKNSLFKGKPLKIVFDSLKNFKFGIADYDPPYSDDDIERDTVFTNQMRIYFKPGVLVVGVSHANTFFSNNLKDTLNTHVPYIKVKFVTPIPFLEKWYSFDKEGLGSIKWNTKLENYWGKCIVSDIVVGEY